MRNWFGAKRETHQPVQPNWALRQAVEQALRDWKYAQNRVSNSLEDQEIDDAILYLQLTEKRYMFLLNQARNERLSN